MTEQAETVVDEITLETEAEPQPDQEVEQEAQAETPDDQTEQSDQAEEEGDEIVITIDGDSPSQADADVPKDRAAWAKLRSENARLKREADALKEASKPKEDDTLGPKPTLANPTGNPEDEYDADKFEAALIEWTEKKRKYDESQAKKQETEKAAQAAWQQRVQANEEGKKSIKAADVEECEAVVRDTLNPTQQALLVKYLDNAPVAVYALGKSEKHLKELASETDPILFAIKARELEKKVNVTPRKTAPPPERRISGSASTQGSDATLEKLREEASRTGDISKVVAYKAKLKAQGK